MCVLSRSSFFRQTLTLVTKTGTREESSSARWCSSWEIRRSSRTIRPACTATSISRRRYVSVSPPLSLSVLTFHYAGLLLRNLQCYRWQDQGPEGRRRRSFRSVVGRPRNPPQGQVEGGPLRRSHLHRRPEIRLSRMLWSGVTQAIKAKDLDGATEAKSAIEDAQREQAREREQKGVAFEPKYFKPTGKGGEWRAAFVCVFYSFPLSSFVSPSFADSMSLSQPPHRRQERANSSRPRLRLRFRPRTPRRFRQPLSFRHGDDLRSGTDSDGDCAGTYSCLSEVIRVRLPLRRFDLFHFLIRFLPPSFPSLAFLPAVPSPALLAHNPPLPLSRSCNLPLLSFPSL
jgi:hypothetical protein